MLYEIIDAIENDLPSLDFLLRRYYSIGKSVYIKELIEMRKEHRTQNAI